MINYTRTLLQYDFDEVLQAALQVSASATGSMRASTVVDASNRWSYISGDRSIGRYAVASTRTGAAAGPPSPGVAKLARAPSASQFPKEVVDSKQLGVEMDLQIGQLTLRSKHLTALDSKIANLPDVSMIFGDSTMQASLIEKAEHRQRYNLVGKKHDLEYWPTAHTSTPPLGDEYARMYDPAELFETESWIPKVWEPIREAFYVPAPPDTPVQFMMPEFALPKDAEVAVLVGLHKTLGGPAMIVFIFKRLKCVNVYDVISHGRQWWLSQYLATDSRYSLRELQPSYEDRKGPYPSWWEYGAAGAHAPEKGPALLNNAATQSAESVVIVRDKTHEDNISGGKETLIPKRLLYGLIPECLLDSYRFWQDEAKLPRSAADVNAGRWYKRLRGYPLALDGEHIIIVELQGVGSWSAPNGSVMECTGLPGRCIPR